MRRDSSTPRTRAPIPITASIPMTHRRQGVCINNTPVTARIITKTIRDAFLRMRNSVARSVGLLTARDLSQRDPILTHATPQTMTIRTNQSTKCMLRHSLSTRLLGHRPLPVLGVQAIPVGRRHIRLRNPRQTARQTHLVGRIRPVEPENQAPQHPRDSRSTGRPSRSAPGCPGPAPAPSRSLPGPTCPLFWRTIALNLST